MATDPIGINIKQLPQITTIQGGDYLIVETPDGTGIIDYQDVIIDLEQTSFEPTILNLVDAAAALSAQYTALSSNVYDAVVNEIGFTSVVFKNISPLTGGEIFSGIQGIDLPLNYIEVNQITTQQVVDEFTINDVCANNFTLSKESSAFLLPPGTYKAFVNVTMSSLVSGTSLAKIYLYQTTPPEQVLIMGSSFTTTTKNQQGSLNITGFFKLCKSAEVTIRAATTNQFKLGSITPADLATGLIGLSSTGFLNTTACNISMYLEKIQDAFAPTVNLA